MATSSTETTYDHETAAAENGGEDIAAPVQAPACPDWCLDKPGHYVAGNDDGTGDRLHKGPLFGDRLRGWGYERGDGRPMSISIEVEPGDDVATAAELLSIARAAEQAAEWLEGVQQRFREEQPA